MFSLGSIVFILVWVFYFTVHIEQSNILGTLTEVSKSGVVTVTPTVKITPMTTPSLFQNEYLVTRVVDGDTIEIAIEGGVKKVRYIGINAPETVDPRKKVGCYGKEAAQKNRELVEGEVIRLERDVSDTDSFGRLLRYVYVGERMVNEILVEEGYAHASAYPPDVQYQDVFEAKEERAKTEQKGLWGFCPL